MELIISDRLLNKLSAAIELQRPELFGAHTKRYNKKITFPWNVNIPAAPIPLSATKSEIDYDARGTSISMSATEGILVINASLDIAAMQTTKSASVEARFSQKVEISGSFDAVAGQNYPFIVSKAMLMTLEPPGIRVLMSWMLSESLTSAFSGTGFPLLIPIIGKLAIKLGKPGLANGHIRVSGKLEVAK